MRKATKTDKKTTTAKKTQPKGKKTHSKPTVKTGDPKVAAEVAMQAANDLIAEQKLDTPKDLRAKQSVNPFENAIAVQINKHRFGVRRKVEDVDATKDGQEVSRETIAVSKKLLQSDEYNKIALLDNQIKWNLDVISVPSILKQAVVLIPLPLFDRAVKMIDQYQADRAAAVDAFMASYDAVILKAQQELGPLFDRSQYPSPGEVRSRFSVDVSYVDFSISENLRKANSELYERERKKLEATMAEAAEDIRAALRLSLSELLNALTERLSGKNANGKPLVFQDSTVTNMNEWLELFSARNVASDNQLAKLVEKCKATLQGVEPDDLRKQADVREVAAKELSVVKNELDKLLTIRPSRKFSMEDK